MHTSTAASNCGRAGTCTSRTRATRSMARRHTVQKKVFPGYVLVREIGRARAGQTVAFSDAGATITASWQLELG